jgi:sulfonate transport system permease protein
VLPWIVPVGLLASWQLFSQLGAISPKVLPAPLAVLESAIRLTQSGELPLHLLESFRRAMAGLIIGGLLGFGFAYPTEFRGGQIRSSTHPSRWFETFRIWQ